jgi:hypothetical protein
VNQITTPARHPNYIRMCCDWSRSQRVVAKDTVRDLSFGWKQRVGSAPRGFRTIQICPKDMPAILRQCVVRKTKRTGPVGGAGTA